MSKTIGIGVIGTGRIFAKHAAALKALSGRMRVVGLADPDPVNLRSGTEQVFAPVAVNDYHELLKRDDIDLIDICTPPHLHEQLAIDALDAGKYVTCEKPLAHTLAATDRIVEAAKRHPGRLSTIFQLRYHPDARQAVWLRDSGKLGPLRFADVRRLDSLRGSAQAGKTWWGAWDVAGGGALMTQAIHELDLAMFLMGPIRRVTAHMTTLANRIVSEDTVTATLEYSSGAVGSFSWGWRYPDPRHSNGANMQYVDGHVEWANDGFYHGSVGTWYWF
jgi:prepilin-type processing-associated H-X9-DG protein